MKIQRILLCLLFVLLVGCATQPRHDTITQVSTIDILLAGLYDGEMTLGEILKYGDFGIGTFDRLEGEMIVLDGTVYQVKADGSVHRPPAGMTTPFAAVSAFHGEKVVDLNQTLDFDGLCQLLDATVDDPHLFYAIKVTGRFSHMHTRSVPAQQKPYPPLIEVAKEQPEFKMSNVSGTIVGYRCPEYVQGINVPGYHLHFLSDDHTQGGHILGFELDEGRAEIDTLNRFTLVMPRNADGRQLLDLSRDRSTELESVER